MRSQLAAWWRRNRRRVMLFLLFCGAMFAIGYLAPRAASPLMCKVYG